MSSGLGQLTRYRFSPARYRFIRQSITLDGMGTQSFSNALHTTRLLHEIFDRTFEENRLEQWTNSEDTLETSNRFLTPKNDAPDSKHVAFGKYVDPKGVLESMLGEGSGFVHTGDNVVEYFQRITDANGITR